MENEANYNPATHYRDERAGGGWGGNIAWADTEVTADVATYRAWHYDQVNTTGVTWPHGTAPSYSDLLEMVAQKHDTMNVLNDVVNDMLESDESVARYRELAKTLYGDDDEPIPLYPDHVNSLDTEGMVSK